MKYKKLPKNDHVLTGFRRRTDNGLYQAKCSCGWVGYPYLTKREAAVSAYLEHRANVAQGQT